MHGCLVYSDYDVSFKQVRDGLIKVTVTAYDCDPDSSRIMDTDTHFERCKSRQQFRDLLRKTLKRHGRPVWASIAYEESCE